MDVQDFIINRDQHMRPLEYDLSENFNELVRYLNDMGVLDNVPVGVNSESEIASVSDAYPAPPRAINVYGKSTQDGTPTPDAPVPILSVDELALEVRGKNLLDNDGYFPTENSIAQNAYYFEFSAVRSLIPTIQLVENVTYTCSMNVTSSAQPFSLSVGAGSGNYTRDIATASYLSNGRVSVTFTPTQTDLSRGNIFAFRVPRRNTPFADECTFTISDVQLEFGSTPTTYEPYVGTTVPNLLPEGTDLRSLPDGTKDTLSLSYLRPSTRPGWAWYSREVVRRMDVLDLGTRKWTAHATKPNVFYASMAGTGGQGVAGSVDMANVLCTALRANKYANVMGGNTDNIINYASTTNFLYAYSSAYDTAADFKTAVSGVTLQYLLATPVTTTLDPIELPTLPAPNATVWCDGGSATPTFVLEYVKDANASIAELSEAIADIVSG